MLRAIAIYERNEQDGTFTRKEAVEKPGTFFIPNRDLKYFESFTLHQLNNNEEILSGEVMFTAKREPVKGFLSVFYDANDTEYYYGKYIPETNHLLILISKNPLLDLEPHFLLINTNHADQGRLGSDSITTILRNPIGYIAKDRLPDVVRQGIEKAKMIAIKAKAAAGMRGEAVSEAQDKTEMLYQKSDTFKLSAKDIDVGYTCCGGVFRNPFS